MSRTEGLEEKLRLLRKAAEVNGAKIIPVPLLGGSDSLMVLLESDHLLDLIPHLRPKVLYLWEEKFDAAQSAAETIVGDDDDDFDDDEIGGKLDVNDNPKFRSLVSRWRKHNGEVAQFVATLMFDGVLHVVRETTEWFELFEDEVNEFTEAQTKEREELAARLDATAQAETRDKARQLVKHPQFNAPRASHAKRARLAQQLFLDVAEENIDSIVTEAEAIFWLESGRQ